jgi:GTPase SAR1 family protein
MERVRELAAAVRPGDPRSAHAALGVLMTEAEASGVDAERIAALRSKLEDPRLVISVVALMKAGKSTLLNSLLHQEFLPSAAQAATACVTRIVHDESVPEGRLESEGQVIAEGRAGVNHALKNVNALRRDGGIKAARLNLRYKVPLFVGAAQGRSVELVDTPGPNEADAGLEDEVMQILEETDAILYVLDFTKIGTEDERKMLNMLSEAVRPLLDSANDDVARIHFVLNKVDAHSARNDPPLAEMMAQIATKISAIMPISVAADRLWPVAANLGLMARQVLCTGEPDNDFLEDFLRKAVGECFEDLLSPEEYLPKARALAVKMAEKSRLDALEGLLRTIAASKDAIVAKSVLGTLLDDLRARHDALATRQSVLSHSREANEAAVKTMREAREAILSKRAILDTEAQAALDSTKETAKELFVAFSADVEGTIAVLVDPNVEVSSSKVKMFMKLYTTIFTTVQSLLAEGAKDMLSREEAEEKADKVNQGIAELLSAKWGDYNTQLYHQMFIKHKDLDKKMDKAARPLLKQLQDSKSSALDTRMQIESEIVTAPISAVEFREKASVAMLSMIDEKRKALLHEEEKTRTVKKVMCGMEKEEELKYTVFYKQTETTYELNPIIIRDHWLAEIRDRIENSQKSTDLLIQKMVGDEVNRIWREVTARADASVANLENEVAGKEAEDADAAAELVKVGQQISTVHELEEIVVQLTQAVETAFGQT